MIVKDTHCSMSYLWRAVPAKFHLLETYILAIFKYIFQTLNVYYNLPIYILNSKNIYSKF